MPRRGVRQILCCNTSGPPHSAMLCRSSETGDSEAPPRAMAGNPNFSQRAMSALHRISSKLRPESQSGWLGATFHSRRCKRQSAPRSLPFRLPWPHYATSFCDCPARAPKPGADEQPGTRRR